MAPSINDFKVYMPAKDFERSKRFYVALGFAMSEGWGGTADFELNGNRFRLQNYYVKDWAENFMVVMRVDDAHAWYEHVRSIADSGEFDGVRIKRPETVDGSLVLHVIDPSGVLLIFVQ
ncbi:MAG: VOC family protein [Planctomycetota bacterium]|nr:VOC family protein [Planctomycetota bacterium]